MVKLEGAKDNRYGGLWNIIGTVEKDGSILYGLKKMAPNEIAAVGTKAEAPAPFADADVVIRLYTPESVDSMIDALQTVKRRMRAKR